MNNTSIEEATIEKTPSWVKARNVTPWEHRKWKISRRSWVAPRQEAKLEHGIPPYAGSVTVKCHADRIENWE
jgi:hypothetical protein